MRRLAWFGLVVVTALAGCSSGGRPSTSAPETPTARPSIASLPTVEAARPRFIPQSVSFVSRRRGWAFGPAGWPTGRPATATAVLAVTSNRGRTWRRLPTPPARYAMTTGGVRWTRFLDVDNGYLYGEGVYATHDGGRRWHRVPSPGTVLQLQTLGARTIALGCSRSRGYCHSSRVYLADRVGQRFRRVRGITVGSVGQLAVSRSHAFLLAPATHDVSRLLLWSSGDGEHWTSTATPCQGGWSDAGALATVGATGLALVCGYPPSAGQQWKVAYRSADVGVHWSAPHRLRETSGYVGVLAAADGKTWVLGLYRGGLLATHNSGKTWSQPRFPRTDTGIEGFGQIQFTGGHDAVAVPWTLNGDIIAFTSDAGDTWTTQRFQPADT